MSEIQDCINQIRETLTSLVLNTDVSWDIVQTDDMVCGIRFQDSEQELDTIWEDEV